MHCATLDDAMSFLRKIKDPKASHNCYAWRDASGTMSKCSDDGEPGGTAGRPILNAIETEGIVDVMVVVTRYFGGTELGKGGLSRGDHLILHQCQGTNFSHNKPMEKCLENAFVQLIK